MNILNYFKNKNSDKKIESVNMHDLTNAEIEKLNKKVENIILILKIVFFVVPIAFAISAFWLGVNILFLSAIFALIIGIYIVDTTLKYNDKENLIYIKATCSKRRRGGYRFQYHNFTFIYKDNNEEENSFSILSTQKNQFIESKPYIFLLNIKDTDISEINKKNIITFLDC